MNIEEFNGVFSSLHWNYIFALIQRDNFVIICWRIQWSFFLWNRLFDGRMPEFSLSCCCSYDLRLSNWKSLYVLRCQPAKNLSNAEYEKCLCIEQVTLFLAAWTLKYFPYCWSHCCFKSNCFNISLSFWV